MMYRKNPASLMLLLLLLVLTALFSGCGSQDSASEGGYQVTDDQGTVVSFQEKPQRIVSLTMSTDNILLGLVKPERVVCANVLVDDPVSSNVVELGKNSFAVATGKGVLEVLELQPPSKKRMSAGDFVRGHGVKIGAVFS